MYKYIKIDFIDPISKAPMLCMHQGVILTCSFIQLRYTFGQEMFTDFRAWSFGEYLKVFPRNVFQFCLVFISANTESQGAKFQGGGDPYDKEINNRGVLLAECHHAS